MISIDIIYTMITHEDIFVRILTVLKKHFITEVPGLFMLICSMFADVEFENRYAGIGLDINKEEGNVLVIKIFTIVAWITFVLSLLFYLAIFDYRVLIFHGSLLFTILLFKIAERNFILIAYNKK